MLRGYASMAAELAGAQWNEGDVFCSVVRRVALPDAFFAIDGQIETFLTVLDEFGAYPAVIQRELDRYSAVPGHHADPDRGGARRHGPRGGARGDQGARRRGRAGDAREGCWSPTCSTGWPPIRGCRWTGRRSTRRWPTSRRSPAPRAVRSTRSSTAVDELVSRYPEAAKYTSGAIL